MCCDPKSQYIAKQIFVPGLNTTNDEEPLVSSMYPDPSFSSLREVVCHA
jgi:hypothetical protein